MIQRLVFEVLSKHTYSLRECAYRPLTCMVLYRSSCVQTCIHTCMHTFVRMGGFEWIRVGPDGFGWIRMDGWMDGWMDGSMDG